MIVIFILALLVMIWAVAICLRRLGHYQIKCDKIIEEIDKYIKARAEHRKKNAEPKRCHTCGDDRFDRIDVIRLSGTHTDYVCLGCGDRYVKAEYSELMGN